MELLGYGHVTFIPRFPSHKGNIWGETRCDSDLSESPRRLMKCIEFFLPRGLGNYHLKRLNNRLTPAGWEENQARPTRSD